MTNCETWIMTLRSIDLQSDSDLDSIHNSCDVLKNFFPGGVMFLEILCSSWVNSNNLSWLRPLPAYESLCVKNLSNIQLCSVTSLSELSISLYPSFQPSPITKLRHLQPVHRKILPLPLSKYLLIHFARDCNGLSFQRRGNAAKHST